MKVGDQAQARGDDAGNGGHQEDLVECGTTSLVGGEDSPGCITTLSTWSQCPVCPFCVNSRCQGCLRSIPQNPKATVASTLTTVNHGSPISTMIGTASAVNRPPPRNGSYGSCL